MKLLKNHVNGQRKHQSKKCTRALKKAVVSYCENEVLGHPVLQGKEMIEFKVAQFKAFHQVFNINDSPKLFLYFTYGKTEEDYKTNELIFFYYLMLATSYYYRLYYHYAN